MMKTHATRLLAILGGVLLCGASMLLACDDTGSNAVKESVPPKDSGTILPDSAVATDGGPLPDGAPSDCFMNPKTHVEIINACTDAIRITKNPALPLLSPDGGLPPLP